MASLGLHSLFKISVIYLSFSSGSFVLCDDDSNKLVILTVATEETEGYNRFVRSANVYGLNVQVLGMNEKWEGGDIQKRPGGGHKVNLLKKALEGYKDQADLILMFVDSYDVIFTAGEKELLKKFFKTKSKVLFSAEGFCWPDNSLAEKYPQVDKGKRFLNSGACSDFSYTGFMGYAPSIYDIVTSSEIGNLDDDQLFYTKIYLSEDIRKRWFIKLDHKAQIFQNLNGAVGDVELRFSAKDSYVHNIAYATTPLVIHGNGPSKIPLNNLGNYLAKSWLPKEGCLSCSENVISLARIKVQNMPRILMAIFIERPVPFLSEFFSHLLDLTYPKERMDLFIHNAAEYHEEQVGKFLDQHKHKYNSVMYLRHDDGFKEWHARNLGLEECFKLNCDYYFSVDAEAQLLNADTLRILIEQNRLIIAPMLVRPKSLWANFWAALSADGFYSRSHDYVDIIKSNRKGLWNVPFISSCYLIRGELLKDKEKFLSFINGLLDPDMAFCRNVRDRGVFMYVLNLHEFGHLINAETFDTSRLHSELHEIYSNQKDWEMRYIHENYSTVLEQGYEFEMPCPDVYWFPIVSPTFCKHLIETMENFGKWSDGTNQDSRLSGGYENVPTRDIHMNQVGLEQQWLYFLREYIRPVQEKLFIGYYHDPPRSIMNFVVRYKPDEQPSLRPHHDASTYTINMALNKKGIDYEGGGCRFVRYNCSTTDLKVGWSLMHPGRLTHYHEGLLTTKGIRYIMISFVDP